LDIYTYWLTTVYNIGAVKQNLLLRHFGNAEAIYNATVSDLQNIKGLTENNIGYILKSKNFEQVKYGAERLNRVGISFVGLHDENYPAILKDIAAPPVGLFCLGKIPDKNLGSVAIIGSRNSTEYGQKIAHDMGKILSNENIVVVSGMAYGIDSMAHRGALEGTGQTIAVLGCGVDICYPAENRKLRDAIAQKGCIISEYPPGVTPRPYHFPARNRIISGLSQLVIVVECGKKSGTLLTVDHALEQGRSVMAVPGNITSKYSEGTNGLIKQGAEPMCRYEDIFFMLETTGKVKIATKLTDIPLNSTSNVSFGDAVSDAKKQPQKINVAENEKIVYYSLEDTNPLSIEEIIVKTQESPQNVQYILTMLELNGLVRKLPGMRYIKT